MTRLLIPLVLLLSLSAHATLVARPESRLTNAPLDVAGFDQNHGRIATDGTGFFAIWKDALTDLHGVFLDPEGKRLHDTPLRIAGGTAMDDPPGVEAGGERYLVAWTTVTPAGGVAHLQARLVTDTGGMTPVLDLGESERRGRPRVAFNGSHFLVMWLAPDLHLRGGIVRPNGELLRTFDIGTAALSYPDMPLWASGERFYFAIGRIDVSKPAGPEGNVAAIQLVSLDEEGNVAAPIQLAPALTPVFHLRADERDGTAVVAWSSAVFNPGQISSVRITSAGAGPVETFDAGLLRLHDIVADGSDFLLVYGNDIERRVRYAGSSAESVVPAPLLPMMVDDAASNGTKTLLLARVLPDPRRSGEPLGNDLYIQHLDGAPLEPLALAPRHQAAPALATASDLRLAVWSEHLGAQRRITFMAARIDAAGRVLDSDGIDLGLDLPVLFTPHVASNGTDWLVVWAEYATVYGMRIARDGTRLDAEPFVIADDTIGETDVSWDGQQYVVAFSRGIFLRGLQTRMLATRVHPDGTVRTPEIELVSTAAHEVPAVASDPATGTSLVVWRNALRIQAALLSREGTPVTVELPVPVVAPPLANASGFFPTVAWNAGTFLVAAPYRSALGIDMHWHPVSPAGVVRTPLFGSAGILPMGGGAIFPMLEPYGDGFLLYIADRSIPGIIPNSFRAPATMTVTKIRRDGTRIDGPTAIAETVSDIRPPAAVSGLMTVYTRLIGHPVRDITRLFMRVLEDVPQGPRRRAVR